MWRPFHEPLPAKQSASNGAAKRPLATRKPAESYAEPVRRTVSPITPRSVNEDPVIDPVTESVMTVPLQPKNLKTSFPPVWVMAPDQTPVVAEEVSDFHSPPQSPARFSTEGASAEWHEARASTAAIAKDRGITAA